MDARPNIKARTMKLLEENMGEYVSNLRVGTDFLEST